MAVLENVTPAAGTPDPIARTTIIEFDINEAVPVDALVLYVKYDSNDGSDLIWDGEGFVDEFSASPNERVGQHFRVRPRGGWAAAPTLGYAIGLEEYVATVEDLETRLGVLEGQTLDARLDALEDDVHTLQSLSTEIASNTTTASTADPPTVDLISQVITTVAGTFVDIDCSFCVQNDTSGAAVRFTVKVDGALVANGSGMIERISANAARASGSFMARLTGLSAAAHTVLVEWSTSAGTARINPAGTDYEHFRLTVAERKAGL